MQSSQKNRRQIPKFIHNFTDIFIKDKYLYLTSRFCCETEVTASKYQPRHINISKVLFVSKSKFLFFKDFHDGIAICLWQNALMSRKGSSIK